MSYHAILYWPTDPNYNIIASHLFHNFEEICILDCHLSYNVLELCVILPHYAVLCLFLNHIIVKCAVCRMVSFQYKFTSHSFHQLLYSIHYCKSKTIMPSSQVMTYGDPLFEPCIFDILLRVVWWNSFNNLCSTILGDINMYNYFGTFYNVITYLNCGKCLLNKDIREVSRR